MEFTFKPKSLIFTVGPSYCGKSTFCEFVSNQLTKQGYSVKVFSTDEIRRFIIGENLHKHANGMLHVSSQAFDLLHSYMNAFMSFPLKYDFILVDSTAMQKETRENFVKIANKYQYFTYSVIFAYYNIGTYYEFTKVLSKSQ